MLARAVVIASAAFWICSAAAACSSPSDAVIVEQPAPAPTTPVGSRVDAGGDAAVDAARDAATDSSSDGAVAPTCSGATAMGNAVDDCAPAGACPLTTCTDGITYLCHDSSTGTGSPEQGGWPVGVASYYSHQDSAQTGYINCALPQCVHRVYSDPGATIPVWSCPPGMMPSEPGKTCTEFGAGTAWGSSTDPMSATATVYRCL